MTYIFTKMPYGNARNTVTVIFQQNSGNHSCPFFFYLYSPVLHGVMLTCSYVNAILYHKTLVECKMSLLIDDKCD